MEGTSAAHVLGLHNETDLVAILGLKFYVEEEKIEVLWTSKIEATTSIQKARKFHPYYKKRQP